MMINAMNSDFICVKVEIVFFFFWLIVEIVFCLLLLIDA